MSDVFLLRCQQCVVDLLARLPLDLLQRLDALLVEVRLAVNRRQLCSSHQIQLQ